MNFIRSKYVSRKRTPWNNNYEISPLELFIKDNYAQRFHSRHPKLKEDSLLNSFPTKNCRLCDSAEIKKNGKSKNGIQRYYCNACCKSFNLLTNTIFDNHKISISEWIEFLLYLFGFESIQAISKSNKNSVSTTKYWIKKLFLVLEHYQDNIKLKGNIYLDETLYKVRAGEIQHKENGKEYRGLSRNQICIGVATDETNVYAKVEGFGKTSDVKTIETFKDHIEVNAHLIHDKEKSHRALIKLLSLSDVAYDGNEIKKFDDKDNPLEPINRVIFFLQKFLNSHPGFNRDELQGYLNLFAFISNEKGEPLDKVKRMVYLTLTTRISLKYREYYRKKPKIE